MVFATRSAKAIFNGREEEKGGTVVEHDIRYRFSDSSVILFIAPRRSKA